MNFLKISKKVLLVLALLTSFNFAFGMEQKQGDDGKKHKPSGLTASFLSLMTKSKPKETSAEKIAYFDKLPDIILAEIFKKINNPKDIFALYKANKRFRNILKLIPLEVNIDSFDDEELIRWANFFPRTESIFANNNNKLTNRSIKILGIMCKKLRSFSLNSNLSVTDESVEFLVDNCPKLRNIKFTKCPNLTGRVIDKIINLCNRYPEELFEIDFTGCMQITHLDSIKLANACSNIKSFSINCDNIDDAEIYKIILQMSQELLYKITSICFYNCNNLSDNVLKKIFEKCSSVKYLEFCKSNIADEVFNSINSNLRLLDTFIILTPTRDKN